MARKTQQKKVKNKRHRLGVGDMIQYHSPNVHMTGVIGEVKAVLDKKRVVVKCVGIGDEDWSRTWAVVETRMPEGQTPDGDDWARYAFYVERVLYRAKPKPPKEPKKVIPAKVIETQADLIDHLRSKSDEKVVVHPTATGAAV